MTKKVELTDLETSIIENALIYQYDDINNRLVTDVETQELGDVEKKILIQQRKLLEPIIKKFENL